MRSAVEGAEGVGAVQEVVPSEDGSTVMINALLAENPFENKALDPVASGGPIRAAAHEVAPEGTTVLVGGASAAYADVRQATTHDLKVIFPVAGVLILLVLRLLLRSLVAPFYLLASVVLVFLGTLGATVIAFIGIGTTNGLMFMLPIIVYLFVVAIGTDDNILMIARLREKAQEGRSPREAVGLAIEHAGPSVASVAVILAGSFASLMLAGISLLTQLGFAVAIGILLSAFVISTMFVPAITALVGHAAWWPGHGDRASEELDVDEPELVSADR